MNVVMLKVLSSPDVGEMRIAIDPEDADRRWILWTGIPGVLSEGRGLPSVGCIGDLDGRRAYVEKVPTGVLLTYDVVPADLVPTVMRGIFEALSVLHAQKKVHGMLSVDRVWLDVHGDVWLLGRGRRGGTLLLDVIAAYAVESPDQEQTFPGEDAAKGLAFWESRCADGDRAALGKWVSELSGYRHSEEILFSPIDEGMDEVVPDWGSDVGSEGLLDRWTGTTGITSEATPGVRDSTQEVSNSEGIWREIDRWALQPFPESAEVDLAALELLRSQETNTILWAPVPRDVPTSEPEMDTATMQRSQLFRPPVVLDAPKIGVGRRAAEWLFAMALGAFLMWLAVTVFGGSLPPR